MREYIYGIWKMPHQKAGNLVRRWIWKEKLVGWVLTKGKEGKVGVSVQEGELKSSYGMVQMPQKGAPYKQEEKAGRFSQLGEYILQKGRIWSDPFL